jgi:hypothetical protein
LDGRNMAMVEGKFKQKKRAALATHEYKFHD